MRFKIKHETFRFQICMLQTWKPTLNIDRISQVNNTSTSRSRWPPSNVAYPMKALNLAGKSLYRYFKNGRRKFGFEQLSERPGLSTTITKSIRLDKMPETLYYYWIYWSQNQYRWFRESAVLIAITVHSGNKHFNIIEYELHITDILEYGEARIHSNFQQPATRSDI